MPSRAPGYFEITTAPPAGYYIELPKGVSVDIQWSGACNLFWARTTDVNDWIQFQEATAPGYLLRTLCPLDPDWGIGVQSMTPGGVTVVVRTTKT